MPSMSLAVPLWKTANARTPGSLTGNKNQSCPKISVSKHFHLKSSACSWGIWQSPQLLIPSGEGSGFWWQTKKCWPMVPLFKCCCVYDLSTYLHTIRLLKQQPYNLWCNPGRWPLGSDGWRNGWLNHSCPASKAF